MHMCDISNVNLRQKHGIDLYITIIFIHSQDRICISEQSFIILQMLIEFSEKYQTRFLKFTLNFIFHSSYGPN